MSRTRQVRNIVLQIQSSGYLRKEWAMYEYANARAHRVYMSERENDGADASEG